MRPEIHNADKFHWTGSEKTEELVIVIPSFIPVFAAGFCISGAEFGRLRLQKSFAERQIFRAMSQKVACRVPTK